MGSAVVTANGGTLINTVTKGNKYVGYDRAALMGIRIATYNGAASDTAHTLARTLSATGAAAAATIADGRPRTISFTYDASGQMEMREEVDEIFANCEPHSRWDRFDGREIGIIGNDGATDASYDASVDTRRTTPGAGPFRGGAASGLGYARFGQGFDTFSSLAQGADGGRYTVQSDDTLASVAQAL